MIASIIKTVAPMRAFFKKNEDVKLFYSSLFYASYAVADKLFYAS